MFVWNCQHNFFFFSTLTCAVRECPARRRLYIWNLPSFCTLSCAVMDCPARRRLYSLSPLVISVLASYIQLYMHCPLSLSLSPAAGNVVATSPMSGYIIPPRAFGPRSKYPAAIFGTISGDSDAYNIPEGGCSTHLHAPPYLSLGKSCINVYMCTPHLSPTLHSAVSSPPNRGTTLGGAPSAASRGRSRVYMKAFLANAFAVGRFATVQEFHLSRRKTLIKSRTCMALFVGARPRCSSPPDHSKPERQQDFIVRDPYLTSEDHRARSCRRSIRSSSTGAKGPAPPC